MSLPSVDDLTPEQQRELAESYMQLLEQMRGALEVCTTGYGFFSYLPGRVGFRITGHPPLDLVERLRNTPREEHE
jgi:hypothetical protein